MIPARAFPLIASKVNTKIVPPKVFCSYLPVSVFVSCSWMEMFLLKILLKSLKKAKNINVRRIMNPIRWKAICDFEDKGFCEIPSIKQKKMCPPSKIGMGSRFIIINKMLMAATNVKIEPKPFLAVC